MIRPPLFVLAEDGLVAFDSVEYAQGYMEAPDVEAGVYRAAYDSEGRPIAIALSGEQTELRPLADAPPQALELRRLIEARFTRLFVPLAELEALTQEELIDEAWRHFRPRVWGSPKNVRFRITKGRYRGVLPKKSGPES